MLEIAFAAGCDSVGTANTRDLPGSAKLGVAVLTPGQFLKILGEQT